MSGDAEAEAILKTLAHAIEWKTPWAGGDDRDGFVEGAMRYYVECFSTEDPPDWRIEYNDTQAGWLRVIQPGTTLTRRLDTREAACELCLHHYTTGKWT